MLKQNVSMPLYEQLKQEIKMDIVNQLYLPGDRMPSELELEKQYKVSRITVRRAVLELCEEGILERKQGKGTFVLNTNIKTRVDRLEGFSDYMGSLGRKVVMPLLEKSCILAEDRLAADLQIAVGSPVFYLKRLMKGDDRMYMIDECFFSLERFPSIIDKYQENMSVYNLLKREYGVTIFRFFKELNVKVASAEEAKLLQCEPGAPLFDIYKITYDFAGFPLQISRDSVRGDFTSYVVSNRDDAMHQEGLQWK